MVLKTSTHSAVKASKSPDMYSVCTAAPKAVLEAEVQYTSGLSL